MNFSDMLVNISQAIIDFVNQMGTWDWPTIVQTFKDTLVSGGVGAAVLFAVKYILPFLRNSNKPILAEVGVIGTQVVALVEEVKKLHDENATLRQATSQTLNYISTVAEVNLASKSITIEQKAQIKAWLDGYKVYLGDSANTVVAQIENVIDDNQITIDEVMELGSNVQVIEKALGTPISQLIPKSGV
jgi:PIN domain nuclease of toxin-antitoxin system